MKLLHGSRCHVVDRFVEAFVVEPVDPVQGLDLDVLDVAPGPFGADQFGLVEPDLGLGQRVVVGIARRTDRGVDASLDEPVGEGEGGVLTCRRRCGAPARSGR